MKQRNVKKSTSIRDKWNVGKIFNIHVTGVLDETEEGVKNGVEARFYKIMANIFLKN